MANRTQIGAAWGYGDNGGGTTIPLASHDITAGSLVVVAFRHESSDTTMVVTDSASGTWSTAIGQFNGGVKVWLAYSYNHPGGTGIVITGTMGVSQDYRYGAAIELSGIDSTDPIQSGATVTSTTAPLDHSVSFTGDVDIFSIQGNFYGSSYGIVTGSIINCLLFLRPKVVPRQILSIRAVLEARQTSASLSAIFLVEVLPYPFPLFDQWANA